MSLAGRLRRLDDKLLGSPDRQDWKHPSRIQRWVHVVGFIALTAACIAIPLAQADQIAFTVSGVLGALALAVGWRLARAALIFTGTLSDGPIRDLHGVDPYAEPRNRW